MIRRNLEKKLLSLAGKYPVISITGPRQSGKTTLARFVFPEHTYLNLENLDLRSIASEDPRGFLAGNKGPIILDEIQKAPNLVSYLQEIVDLDQTAGRFILTGSENLSITNTVNQSLAGRVAHVTLLPFTIDELKITPSVSSIDSLLYSGFYPPRYDRKIDPYDFYLDYTKSYLERDVRSLLRVKNLVEFNNFLKLCASNVGQLINYSTMSSALGLDVSTVKSWLSILEASYIIFSLRPFSRNIKKRIVKSSKIYFYDIGLLSYLLGIHNQSHVASHPLRGQIFENLIIADILKGKLHQRKNNNLYFYRTYKKEEIDLIFDGVSEVKALEIKSSATFTPRQTKELQKFREEFAENVSGALFLSELNGSNYKGIQLCSFESLVELVEW